MKDPNRPGSRPPGPRGFEILRTIQGLKRHYCNEYLRLFENYGDVVYIPLANRYVFFDPRHIQLLLEKQSQKYEKGKDYRILQKMLGEGLLTSEGDLWKEQRRIVGAEFHTKKFIQFAPLIIQKTEKFLDAWSLCARQGKTTDLAKDFMGLTFEIACAVFFGVSLEEDLQKVGEVLSHNTEFALKKMLGIPPLPYWFPSRGLWQARRGGQLLDEIVYKVIDSYLEEKSEKTNVLSRLIAAQGSGKPSLQERTLLRDQCLTLLLAGHETTSQALSWTVWLLSSHPDLRERLGQEIDTLVGNNTVRGEDVSQMSYVKMVLQESMRLFPPAPALSRTALVEDYVDDYRIPKGAIVEFVSFVTHRHPRYWQNPNMFDPERFRAHRLANLPEGAYFPFGLGARRCIGEGFAYFEMILILAMIYRRFDFEVVNPSEMETLPAITLKPKNGLLVRVKDRQQHL